MPIQAIDYKRKEAQRWASNNARIYVHLHPFGNVRFFKRLVLSNFIIQTMLVTKSSGLSSHFEVH